MTTAPRQGNRLRTLATILDAHLGRTVTIADDPAMTGTLVGVIPVRDRVQLALILGGRRVFTDAMPADTEIEIHQKEKAS